MKTLVNNKHKDSSDSQKVSSTEAKLRKKYHRLKMLFAILLFMFGTMLLLNIDYYIFKILIAGSYAYTGTLDKIYKESLGASNVRGYFYDFDRVIISVFTEKIREIGGDRYTYLYTPQSYRESAEQTKADAAKYEITELDSKCVYIKLPNISSYTRKYFTDNKELLSGYKNIIIDLRSNYGGMLTDYYKISELFLDKGAVIGYETIRPWFLSQTIKAKKDRYFDFENIIVFQNSQTASASEGLIMSLKENLDNVTLIGERTFGKGIGQATVPLTFGYAVKATVLKLTTPRENSIHLQGIEPDFEYEGDDLIEFALSLLNF